MVATNKRNSLGMVEHIRAKAWNEAIDAAANTVANFQSKDVQPIIDELLAFKTEVRREAE